MLQQQDAIQFLKKQESEDLQNGEMESQIGKQKHQIQLDKFKNSNVSTPTFELWKSSFLTEGPRHGRGWRRRRWWWWWSWEEMYFI